MKTEVAVAGQIVKIVSEEMDIEPSTIILAGNVLFEAYEADMRAERYQERQRKNRPW